MKRFVVWDELGRAAQRRLWKQRIDEASGNIARAAREMGFSARYGYELTRRHLLNDYAEKVRGHKTGRPKKPRICD